MAQRKCIFCGGGPLTQEHIFAQWIQRLAKIQGAKPASVAFHVPGKAREKAFQAPVFARTARVVCADCNGGWMSQLESEASVILTPLFQGQSGHLSVDDLGALSRWAFKTAVVIDAASLGGEGPLVPEDVRYAFRETLELPEMAAVWLTTWPGTTSAWTQHWGLAISEDPLQEPAGINAYGATIAIFPIVFRTFATSAPAVNPDYFHETVPGIERIWPVTGPLDWEATFWLTAQQLEDFAFGIPRAIGSSQSGAADLRFWHGEDPGPIRGPT